MNKQINIEYYPKLDVGLIQKAVKRINDLRENYNMPFFIDTQGYLDFEEIERVSKQFMEKSIENLIVLGTGGSIQTLLALKPLSSVKIYPITSSRAFELASCLEQTSPDDSLVIPISRGGETLDVNSTIGTFMEKRYPFLGLSSQGTMYELLIKKNIPILDVPDLSGRFAGSISNVGIVPAYISGIKVREFLNSLDEGYKIYMNYESNIALDFAAFLYELYKIGYRVIFSMPYSENLEGSVGLFVQEISESTGKQGKGLMGAFQEGPLCQHSVLEFLLGGSKGNVVPLIWTIDEEKPDITLTSNISYVNNQTAQTIVNYQADATFQALLEQRVPSAKISIKTIDEKHLGKLIAFIQSTVYYLCLLVDVNWANNPKVVIGKKICNQALKSNIPATERIKKREEIAADKFRDFFKKEI
ncbi:MAG: hypothetical protein GF383_09695 [Candidatus Lokiarchaeota archaeon]|nr:hypothetical protein [Candidatus Lokiarchaeota archaeon]MBD3340797.1 hypothetical protein [Candidatus Lokiarchaeota archaeon]